MCTTLQNRLPPSILHIISCLADMAGCLGLLLFGVTNEPQYKERREVTKWAEERHKRMKEVGTKVAQYLKKAKQKQKEQCDFKKMMVGEQVLLR